jgi:predicted PurR-regulated permease PerM
MNSVANDVGKTPSAQPLDFRRVATVVLTLALTVIFVMMIAPFLEPLFLAIVFSHSMYPLYSRLRKPLRRDGLAAFVTTLCTLLVVAVPLIVIGGLLSREALRMTEAAEPWVEERTRNGGLVTVPDWLPFAEQLQPYRAQILERAGEAVGQIGSVIVDNVSRITQGTVALLLYSFVLLYAVFFLLLHGPTLLAKLAEYTPLSDGDQRLIVERGISVTRATLKSILVLGALQGTLGGVGFAFVGIEGAAFWGLVMGIASAVPSVGAALIWGPAALILAISGDPKTGIGIALWGALVVSSVDNILRPYLIGHQARMPDLLVLISTLGGIAMFGASGIIIGPVVAGIFLTSLRIFAATFQRELRTANTYSLLELPGKPRAPAPSDEPLDRPASPQR